MNEVEVEVVVKYGTIKITSLSNDTSDGVM